MDKNRRHKIIIEIVGSCFIRTQKDMVEALRERGMVVTQATVSRDIAEIPLDRARTSDGLIYQWRGRANGPQDSLVRVMRDSVISIEQGENLVVVKTGPGQAAPVAVCLDGARLDNVLGTIAGDDTILIVAQDATAGAEVAMKLEGKMK